jgi:protein-disulfide isomerase
VQRLQKHFGHKLRFAFRNFPLSQIHPHAESAAEVAEFAAAQGKFWEMHQGLFENQTRLGSPLYAELAADCGLSPAALQKALDEEIYKGRVRSDFSGGVRSGVNGTPTFFINGRRHDGSFDYDSLVLAIKEELAAAGDRMSA